MALEDVVVVPLELRTHRAIDVPGVGRQVFDQAIEVVILPLKTTEFKLELGGVSDLVG